MVKNHLKTIAVPKTWHVKRKAAKFITRPNAGAHTLESGMALTTVLRKLVKVAKTAKEVKHVLTEKEVLVDGKKRKEPKLIVGFMDVVSLPGVNESHRILLDRKGRLIAVKISEAEAKETALNRERVKAYIDGKKIARVIYVPRRVVNIVVAS